MWHTGDFLKTLREIVRKICNLYCIKHQLNECICIKIAYLIIVQCALIQKTQTNGQTDSHQFAFFHNISISMN